MAAHCNSILNGRTRNPHDWNLSPGEALEAQQERLPLGLDTLASSPTALDRLASQPLCAASLDSSPATRSLLLQFAQTILHNQSQR